MIIYVETDGEGQVRSFPVPTTVIDPIRQLIGSTDDRNVYPISSTSLNRLSVRLIEQTFRRGEIGEVLDAAPCKFGSTIVRDSTERPVLGVNIEYCHGTEHRYGVSSKSKFWKVTVTRELDSESKKALGDKPWAEFLRQLHGRSVNWFKDSDATYGAISSNDVFNSNKSNQYLTSINNGEFDKVNIVRPINEFNQHPYAVLTNILEIFVGAQQVSERSPNLLQKFVGLRRVNNDKPDAAALIDYEGLGHEIYRIGNRLGLRESITECRSLENFGLSLQEAEALGRFISTIKDAIKYGGQGEKTVGRFLVDLLKENDWNEDRFVPIAHERQQKQLLLEAARFFGKLKKEGIPRDNAVAIELLKTYLRSTEGMLQRQRRMEL